MLRLIKWVAFGLFFVALVLLLFILYLNSPQLEPLDPVHPTQFIQASFTDISKIDQLSIYCPSQTLHYHNKTSAPINLYSPVSGLIIEASPNTFVVRPDSAPGYKVKIANFNLDPEIKFLNDIVANQKIGSLCADCQAETSVYYSSIHGSQPVSYFSVAPTSLILPVPNNCPF